MDKFLEILRKIGRFFISLVNIFYIGAIIIGVIVLSLIIFTSEDKQNKFIDSLQQKATDLSQMYSDKPNSDQSTTSLQSSMKLTSSAFEANGSIPSKYACDGENMSPPLKIADVPENAKSLALILFDPDAQQGKGFTHWVLWNIDPKTSTIAENTPPSNAVIGQNGAGKNSWIAPCPPTGEHHYQFTLYALDTTLNLPESSEKSALEKAMEGHTIEKNMLVGLYQKK